MTWFEQENHWKIQQWYKPRQVADMMNISVKTIMRMINKGELDAKRFGGSIRIPFSEIMRNIRDY